MAVLALLEKLERFLGQVAPATAPDTSEPGTHSLLRDLNAAVEAEITSHFAFEEDSLFPITADAGAEDMNRILKHDHQILLPLGKHLAALAGVAAQSGFSDASWTEFRNSSLEFVDGMRGHIGKEEMGLVPMLEEVLDEQQDLDLIEGYRFS